MTIKEIKKAVNEIADDVTTYRKERDIEDALSTLDELSEHLEAINENSEDDGEYQEIMEIIEDTQHLLNEELDALYDAGDDDDY